MNAVIYARYSSHAQKDASIEQQLRVCRQYAYDHDMQVVGEYCDHALSGTSDKRPEFLRMIKDAAKGRWERVLVYKVPLCPQSLRLGHLQGQTEKTRRQGHVGNGAHPGRAGGDFA